MLVKLALGVIIGGILGMLTTGLLDVQVARAR